MGDDSSRTVTAVYRLRSVVPLAYGTVLISVADTVTAGVMFTDVRDVEMLASLIHRGVAQRLSVRGFLEFKVFADALMLVGHRGDEEGGGTAL